MGVRAHQCCFETGKDTDDKRSQPPRAPCGGMRLHRCRGDWSHRMRWLLEAELDVHIRYWGEGQRVRGRSIQYRRHLPQDPGLDAQPLIRPTPSAAVVDDRLGGCTFLLPGQQIADSNLTVAFEVGGDGPTRYMDDINGTFSAGGTTVNTGDKLTTPLPGVGDKAVWGATGGEYPTVSALKGNVYCSVSTTSDATKLAIIGDPNKPLPVGTQAQQLQYAQLEGKLCTDLFSQVG